MFCVKHTINVMLLCKTKEVLGEGLQCFEFPCLVSYLISMHIKLLNAAFCKVFCLLNQCFFVNILFK